MAHTHNPVNWKAEAGGRGHKFEDSLRNLVWPYLKNEKKV